jgi:SAM-dependent methyltransferase
MNIRDTRAAGAYEWTPDFWQSWREARNPYRHFKSQRDRHIALELLAPRAGDRILEVGCGYGWISETLWQAVDWTGVDRSETMLRRLRSSFRAQGIRSMVADATQLPFADCSFDKVLCTGVLMHISDDDAALSEMARVLRPGGRFLCSINNALSPFSCLTRLWNLSKPGFVQKFCWPAGFRKRLRELGLQPDAMAGDGILTSVSFTGGRLSIPPRFLFPLLHAIDARLLPRWPGLAYEVWFAAAKHSPTCAS